MTIYILRSMTLFLASCVVLACSTVPSEKTSSCVVSPAPLEPYKTDDIKLSLPPGSKLIAENTIDARYWTWETSAGSVSVTWIGGTAREMREADRGAICFTHGKNARFKVYVQEQKVVAVSDALMQNGAGLLVEVESSNSAPSVPVALAIIESIQVAETTGTEAVTSP